MGFSEIFPSYPIQIISPRGGNVKIASRKVYVDFPYVYWNFIGDVAYKISKSKDPQKVFQRELEIFNSDEEIRKIITLNNVPLGTISLITTPFTTKLLLKLRVNWPVFLQYLENKAQELISKIEVDGSNIREVYNEIINNYFKLAHIVPNPQTARFNIYQLENFKKLVRQLQEEQDIRHSLLILKRAISVAETMKLEGIELWALQLEADFSGVEMCLESMDILSCYFYLRNALENLIKLIVYSDIARNFNTCQGMLQVFFFYDKLAKERCYSIQQLKSKYVKRITSYLESTPEMNLEKIYLMIIEKQFPKLSINSHTLEEFESTYNVSIKNYWSACSEVIHNQSPLPFFSLLEVESFKHFLRHYSERFISVIKIIPSIIKVPEEIHFELLIKDIGILPYASITEKLTSEETVEEFAPPKQKLSKKAKGVFRQLIFQEEIKPILKSIIEDKTLRREIFFNPLTLVSLFHLSSPGLTRITSGEFSFEDIEYLIAKIQPVSFILKGGIKLEFYTTLQILEEKIRPRLEKISIEFSKLDEEEKKTIIFYLLAIKLPELFMDK
jgi:hypothetical protein